MQICVYFTALNDTVLYQKQTDNLAYLQNCLENNCLQDF